LGMQQQAAKQITEAMMQTGCFNVIFVINVAEKRVLLQDLTIMKLVFESAPTAAYSIIVNKVAEHIVQRWQRDVDTFTAFKASLCAQLPRCADSVHVISFSEELSGAEDYKTRTESYKTRTRSVAHYQKQPENMQNTTDEKAMLLLEMEHQPPHTYNYTIDTNGHALEDSVLNITIPTYGDAHNSWLGWVWAGTRRVFAWYWFLTLSCLVLAGMFFPFVIALEKFFLCMVAEDLLGHWGASKRVRDFVKVYIFFPLWFASSVVKMVVIFVHLLLGFRYGLGYLFLGHRPRRVPPPPLVVPPPQ